MNRKYFTVVGIFVPVCSFLIACQDYLELDSKSSFSEAYVFSSVEGAHGAVMATYNALTGDHGYGGRLNFYYAMDTDEVQSLTGTNDNGVRSMARYDMTPANTLLEPPFNQLYSGVERANICIKNIPAMDMYNHGTDNEKTALRRLYGEALTLRAQYFFNLVKIWGDVPASFIPSSDLGELFLDKTNRDEIYERILEDLKTAEALVPWRNDPGVENDERITRGAVKGLRARIALFYGGYSLRAGSGKMERRDDYRTWYEVARDECREIMLSGRHQLNPSFEAVFRGNILAHKIEDHGEVIFEVAMAGGTIAADGKIGNIDGTRVENNGQGSVNILPSYFYAFDSLDTRRDVTCAAYSILNGFKIAGHLFTGIDFAKFRRDWVTNPSIPPTSREVYYGINWPLIRYSDVLLMFAEAENELNGGPTPEAAEAFEKVRKRAFLGNENAIGDTPTDKDAFFSAVVEERRLELGGEAIRKYDLIRWNLLHSKILETRQTLTLMAQRVSPYDRLPVYAYYKTNSEDLVWYGSLYEPSPAIGPEGYTMVNWTASLNVAFANQVASGFQPNRSELFPLPQAFINANPKIKQDYGY